MGEMLDAVVEDSERCKRVAEMLDVVAGGLEACSRRKEMPGVVAGVFGAAGMKAGMVAEFVALACDFAPGIGFVEQVAADGHVEGGAQSGGFQLRRDGLVVRGDAVVVGEGDGG